MKTKMSVMMARTIGAVIGLIVVVINYNLEPILLVPLRGDEYSDAIALAVFHTHNSLVVLIMFLSCVTLTHVILILFGKAEAPAPFRYFMR